MHYTTTLALVSLLGAAALPAQGCPLRPYGRTCGPLLSGNVRLDGTLRQIQLQLAGALPNAFGFTIFGDRATERPRHGSAARAAS